ncbi:MAG: response regulator [Desulfatitalea sp.]|nr:response regulator [Desulfatitalea sp.]NNJ99793.1 response regulator [Desulfatitalea sp.]
MPAITQTAMESMKTGMSVSASPPASTPYVLIVDDDSGVREAFKRILTSAGYKVDTADSHANAKALLNSAGYDVILSDIFLGDEDGISLLASCREEFPDIPVILATGMPSLETASAAVRLNAYDYLLKPVSKDRLRHVVNKAVEVGKLKAEKRRIELENLRYQQDLEALVAERTRELTETSLRLREKNAFLNNVIESLQHPFMVIDAEDYTVEIANAAAHRKRRAPGNACFSINRGFTQPCGQLGCHCPVEAVVRTHRSIHTEYQHLDESGHPMEHEEVHAFPLFDDDGHVRQVIHYRLDTTHRRRLEAVAEAANLMENVGFIFSGIRHEIGNPINSIKMALSVLSSNMERYPIETIREFVNRSMGEISRVEYLLRSLKNFSMYETPEVERVDMVSFMRQFYSLVEKDFSGKGIAVTVDATGRNTMACFDPRMLHQVMLNLMTNAADALKDSAEPRIDITIRRSAGCVQVQVIDNGRGMTEKEQRNLFRPFYTSKAQGTGLGLVIVRKMLSLMNGTVGISSSPGAGTTVTLQLPNEQK